MIWWLQVVSGSCPLAKLTDDTFLSASTAKMQTCAATGGGGGGGRGDGGDGGDEGDEDEEEQEGDDSPNLTEEELEEQERLEAEYEEERASEASAQIDGGEAPEIVRRLGAAMQVGATSDAEVTEEDSRELALLATRVAEVLVTPALEDV